MKYAQTVNIGNILWQGPKASAYTQLSTLWCAGCDADRKRPEFPETLRCKMEKPELLAQNSKKLKLQNKLLWGMTKAAVLQPAFTFAALNSCVSAALCRSNLSKHVYRMTCRRSGLRGETNQGKTRRMPWILFLKQTTIVFRIEACCSALQQFFTKTFPVTEVAAAHHDVHLTCSLNCVAQASKTEASACIVHFMPVINRKAHVDFEWLWYVMKIQSILVEAQAGPCLAKSIIYLDHRALLCRPHGPKYAGKELAICSVPEDAPQLVALHEFIPQISKELELPCIYNLPMPVKLIPRRLFLCPVKQGGNPPWPRRGPSASKSSPRQCLTGPRIWNILHLVVQC